MHLLGVWLRPPQYIECGSGLRNIEMGCVRHVTGKHGHGKNGRRVNGIWGHEIYKYALDRAATSKSYQPMCSQVNEGIFDAWSTPVAIEFVAKPTDVPTRINRL